MWKPTGLVYGLLWFFSIISGYAALFCPIFPLLFISNRLYRQLTDIIFTFWQLYPTALVEFWCKCKIEIFGDPVLTGETSILVMNHRTRTDWNFLWPAFYHCTVGPTKYKHPLKFVLKDIIRHLPGPGWVMQHSCFLFVKRSWIHDKNKLGKLLSYFSEISYKFSVLIFPEGTDLTPETMVASNNYAEKNKLQKYSKVLHPRTTGFVYIAQELMKKKNLDSVYDITIVYPDVIPQSETVLLSGNMPHQVKFYLKRYPVHVLPTTALELKIFLENLWLEKEKHLSYHEKKGHFIEERQIKCTNIFAMYSALIFWTILPYFVLYFLYVSYWFKICIVLHTLLLLSVNFFGEGFQEFEVNVFNLKKTFFK